MRYTVKQVTTVLEILSSSTKPQSVAKVGRAIKVTPSEAAELLSRLSASGYAKKGRAKKGYIATLKAWEVGSRVSQGIDLVRAAGPHLRSLSQATGKSVQLAVFDQGRAVYVDVVNGGRVPSGVTLGSSAPATVVSAGKALLAWGTATRLNQAVRELKPFTPLTIRNRAQIEKDLKATRKRGYAINRGEFRVGVGGIAAPVRNIRGSVIGALSICRMPVLGSTLSASQKELASELMKTAKEISRTLGA